MTMSHSKERPSGQFRVNSHRRHRIDRLFRRVCLALTFIGFASLFSGFAAIFQPFLATSADGNASSFVFKDGFLAFAGQLFERDFNYFPFSAGFRKGLFTSGLLVVFTAFLAVPVAVGAAVFLEEFCRQGRLRTICIKSIDSIRFIPSVVVGIFGYMWMNNYSSGLPSWPAMILAMALTLAIICLPVIINATRESLQAIPQSIRFAALALGATRWQLIREHLLPSAFPGIIAGTTQGLSKAIGEASPLIFLVGGVLQMQNQEGAIPNALPSEIYYYAVRPSPAFTAIAAGGILILLTLIIVLQGFSYLIGRHFSDSHADRFSPNDRAGN